MSNLPTVTSEIPNDLREFLNRIREAFNSINENQLITARNLIDAGIAEYKSGALKTKAQKALPKYNTPPAPLNLKTTGALASIILEWDDPKYPGHGYTEIWSAPSSATGSPAIGVAVLAGMAPGSMFSDNIGSGAERYYWIRFVNLDGEAGAYNAVLGTSGKTGKDPTYLLDVLTDSLSAAQFDPTTKTDISTLQDQDTIKTDQQGTVTGYGSSSTSKHIPTSKLVIAVDTFALKAPNFNNKFPFIVQTTAQKIGGITVPPGVYMDDVFIRNGSITAAKIADASIDTAKIADASITSAKIASASVDLAQIDRASIGQLSALVSDLGEIHSGTLTDPTTKKVYMDFTNKDINDFDLYSCKIYGSNVNNCHLYNCDIKYGYLEHIDYALINNRLWAGDIAWNKQVTKNKNVLANNPDIYIQSYRNNERYYELAVTRDGVYFNR